MTNHHYNLTWTISHIQSHGSILHPWSSSMWTSPGSPPATLAPLSILCWFLVISLTSQCWGPGSPLALSFINPLSLKDLPEYCIEILLTLRTPPILSPVQTSSPNPRLLHQAPSLGVSQAAQLNMPPNVFPSSSLHICFCLSLPHFPKLYLPVAWENKRQKNTHTKT